MPRYNTRLVNAPSPVVAPSNSHNGDQSAWLVEVKQVNVVPVRFRRTHEFCPPAVGNVNGGWLSVSFGTPATVRKVTWNDPVLTAGLSALRSTVTV